MSSNRTTSWGQLISVAVILLAASSAAAEERIASPLLDVGDGHILYCWVSNVGTTEVTTIATDIFDKFGTRVPGLSTGCFPTIPPGQSCSISAITARARGVLTVKRGARNLRALCIMTNLTDTPRASAEMR